MSRVVGGQMLFGAREKEVFRKMLRQVADFSGVEVLTYCIMDNHFHVLVRVPPSAHSASSASSTSSGQAGSERAGSGQGISDAELLRRFRVLYPKPTKYQTASFQRFESALQAGSEEAAAMRERLLKRMHDLSEFMKTLKQRFSIWYNRNHDNRLGTLWMERFKSVLVQGSGNPLQTMAAYIDLNPVRAGVVDDPKDYRWCGYAEAVAGVKRAQRGLARIWSTYADGSPRERNDTDLQSAQADHRSLIFGKGSSPWTCRGKLIDRAAAERVLNKEKGELPLAAALRCRVRYFTDGAVLGTAEFARGHTGAWQSGCGRRFPAKVHRARGAPWGDLAVVNALRRQVFS